MAAARLALVDRHRLDRHRHRLARALSRRRQLRTPGARRRTTQPAATDALRCGHLRSLPRHRNTHSVEATPRAVAHTSAADRLLHRRHQCAPTRVLVASVRTGAEEHPDARAAAPARHARTTLK